MRDQLQTAVNEDGFESDIIRRRKLATGRKLEQLVVAPTSEMASMRTLHPLDFVRLKKQEAQVPQDNQVMEAALAHREAGQFKDAIACLHQWMDVHPTDARCLAHLAHALSLDGQISLSDETLRCALMIDASSDVVQRNAARFFLRTRQIDQALAAAQAALNSNAGDAENMAVLASALAAAGAPERGIALLDSALSVRPGYAEALAARAQMRLRAGDTAGALADAQSALASKPHLVYLWPVVGSLRLQANDLEGAAAAFGSALRHTPDNVAVLVNLGEVRRRLGDANTAIQLLGKAVTLDPQNADAWLNIGVAFQQANRIPEARQAMHKSLDIAPERAEIANNLGMIALAEHDLAAAVSYFRRATSIRPAFAQAHANLGEALFDAGDFEGGWSALSTAISHAPAMPVIHRVLGDLLRTAGQPQKAVACYQKVTELDPSDTGLGAAVWVAVQGYLDGDFAQCRKQLARSEPLTKLDAQRYQGFRVYWRYLLALLNWHGALESDPIRAEPPSSIKNLFVVGESHALAAHMTQITFRGQEARCVAQWIPGVKQWHLGNAQPNKFKRAFQVILANLPPASDVLVTIGEIDCRIDEGMLVAWKKSAGKSVNDIATATASSFIRYLTEASKPYAHRMIVSGIPAVNHLLLEGDAGQHILPEYRQEQVQLIRAFNSLLKEFATAAGMGFLDVFALTDRGDGFATGEQHIDRHHLRPDTLVQAFTRGC